ncbi:hypothetical protein FHX69_1410 [Prauserella muralis]|nr:hypothetical protein FHX69_1410 [Prauserella muralis]
MFTEFLIELGLTILLLAAMTITGAVLLTIRPPRPPHR